MVAFVATARNVLKKMRQKRNRKIFRGGQIPHTYNIYKTGEYMKITKIFEIWKKNTEGEYEHKGACIRVLYDLDDNKYKFTFKDSNKRFVNFENVKDAVLSELYSVFTKRISEILVDNNALYKGVVSDILHVEHEIVDEYGLRLELVELNKNWGYTF